MSPEPSNILDSPQAIRKITQISKIIYLDPNKFDNREIMHIIEAVEDWNEKTNGFVHFEIVMLPQKIADFRKGILLMKVSNYYPDIMVLDSLYGGPNTLGLYRGDHPIPHILLVEGRVQDDNFRPTLEHELGHVLGLQHDVSIEGINTLMNPGQDRSSNHITRRDLERLCKVHGCDPLPMMKNVPDE